MFGSTNIISLSNTDFVETSPDVVAKLVYASINSVSLSRFFLSGLRGGKRFLLSQVSDLISHVLLPDPIGIVFQNGHQITALQCNPSHLSHHQFTLSTPQSCIAGNGDERGRRLIEIALPRIQQVISLVIFCAFQNFAVSGRHNG